ncbi:uncharacterized protein CDV56_105670 [Aspergillus thermomutatus]|uniref:Uncharacterized protein n=1 Tax=Aspergillus thermomutatus TaxID=41047 RepID=A0A397HAN7_ASPTH|nr:uncharacterized protein CDV56_105670 [Aspergillus thermomutatus]RHZ59799.1 hypothetical protein CDV56_105670 [Aspergillus thermomutatus]
MPPISGQSLLVIGGSSGIGAAVARLAAEQGVRVSIASSNPTRVANAVAKIKAQASTPDTHIRGFTIDLSLPDVEHRLERLLAETTADSRLDHIVVTAGRAAMLPIARTDREYMLGQAQLTLVVPALLAKLAPRFLKPSYTSSLVFCGGRLDLAPLRVNVVHPGATETEIWGPTPEQRRATREFFASTALLGKVGTPEEVAEASPGSLRILKVASEHPDVATFLESRLAPDMYPLLLQVRIATRHPVRLAEALTAGETWPELITRVKKTLEILAQVGPEEAEIPAAEFTMATGMPETLFHVYITYAILRSKGVDLGKKDVLIPFLPECVLNELPERRLFE